MAPRTKRVIELAVDEARLMGHHYIGTEHLLLGLVREGEGIAVNVLRGLGVNLDRVRTQTARDDRAIFFRPAETIDWLALVHAKNLRCIANKR